MLNLAVSTCVIVQFSVKWMPVRFSKLSQTVIFTFFSPNDFGTGIVLDI